MPAITSETTRTTTTITTAAVQRATPAPSHSRCLRPIRATVIAAATAAASMLTSAAATLAAAAAATTATSTTTSTTTSSNYNHHNSIISLTQQQDTLQQRLQPDVVDTDTGGGSRLGVSVNVALPQRLANNLLNNFLPAIDAVTNATTTTTTPSISSSSSSSGGSSSSRSSSSSSSSVTYPTFRPPSIENLVASSAEDLSNFHDVSFDIFDDDDDLFGSPLAFDASDNGLWNGRFVPPPPRPPFLVDEPVLSDGLTTCDLCSWAMPTKSTFIFEGTIEKASELGWPLTLIIVSVLSALLGAIVMVTVVRCRRKKPTNNRNETHVQWWSRNKRPNGSNNNNHLRRSNIYTAHPADSIRGLQQPSLSAASSLTTMTAMGASAGGPLHSNAVTPNATQPPPQLPHQQQQYYHHPYQQHTLQSSLHRSLSGQQHAPDYEYEHEYHQPQELQLQLQQQQQQQQHQHQRQSSSSMSSLSDSPTLPVANNNKPRTLQLQHQPMQHQQQQQHLAHNVADGVTVGFVGGGGGGMGVGVGVGTTGTGAGTGLGVGLTSRRGATELSDDTSCRWPSATIVVAS